MITLLKNCWPRILGSVVIQLDADECTQSSKIEPKPYKALQAACYDFDVFANSCVLP